MSLTDLAEVRQTSSRYYKEGIDAYLEGVMYEQNPYRNSNDFAAMNEWAAGWCDAEEIECVEQDY